MRRIVLPIFLLISISAFSQKDVNFDDSPSFKDRVFFGGGLGFSANSSFTYVAVSPIVGYMINRRWSAGVGVEYQYYKYKSIPGFPDSEDHRYGGKIFTTYKVYRNLFIYADYNFINLDPTPWLEDTPRETYDRLLLGGGISQPAGRAAINLFAAYDVLYDSGNSPWGSPWVIGVFISI